MFTRVVTYPGLLFALLGGLYVLAKVPEGSRMSLFTMIAALGIGVSELVFISGGLLRRDTSSTVILGRVLLAAGAILLSYGTLSTSMAANVAGSLLFAVGLLRLTFQR
jgi:hypothetical protein